MLLLLPIFKKVVTDILSGEKESRLSDVNLKYWKKFKQLYREKKAVNNFIVQSIKAIFIYN